MNTLGDASPVRTRFFRLGLLVGVVAASYNLLLAAPGLYTNAVLGWAVLGIEYLGIAWIVLRHGAPPAGTTPLLGHHILTFKWRTCISGP